MHVIDICFLLMAISSFLLTYVAYNESRKGHYWNVVTSLGATVVVWLTYLALITFIGEVNIEDLVRRFNLVHIVERLVGGNHCLFFNMPEPSEPESDMAYSSFDSNDSDGNEELEVREAREDAIDEDFNHQIMNAIDNELQLRRRFSSNLRQNMINLRNNIDDAIPEEGSENGSRGGSRAGSVAVSQVGSRAGSRAGSRSGSEAGSRAGSLSRSRSDSESGSASPAPPPEHFEDDYMESSSSTDEDME